MSTSCHALPSGSGTAASGTEAASSVTTPASEPSPFAAHAPLRVEDLHRQQERPAVDRRVAELLGERDDLVLVEADAGPLGPRLGIGRVVDEHRRALRPDERRQRAGFEDVIGGDEDERVLALEVGRGRGERGAVAELPVLGHRGPDAAGGEPVDDRGDGTGLVPDDDDDALEPLGQQPADRPLDQRDPADPDQRLRATARDRGEPLGPPRGEHHPHARTWERDGMTRGAGRRDHGVTGSLGQRLGHGTPFPVRPG